ncbi:SDR family NAD(P)-dependent oxidoreductase [uncultured Bartonella sp.]|uniref:SDR family NAD(P)-dependent oxidoreductase n=1 Tax=uncultured Bartonella sp. TaxID=104108 RepID=UPI00261314EE|nr:SDR family NAD(P)-dependent oxidoreductase [uncultured Bartonella sp.]
MICFRPVVLLKHGVRSIPADTENQTLAELNLALSLNLRCAIQCMQALLPSMKDAGFGRIVNMPSRAALGKELRLAYKETAAGLIGITRIWTLKSKNLVLRSMPLLGTV